MTKIEACKLLGISRSAGFAKAEQAFRKRQKTICLQLVPGNTLADRQKAQAELAKLTTARQIFQTTLTAKPYTRKPMPKKPKQRKTTRPKTKKTKPAPAAVNNHPKPQTLAEAWDLIMTMLPFSQPVVAILLLLMFLLVILRLLSSL